MVVVCVCWGKGGGGGGRYNWESTDQNPCTSPHLHTVYLPRWPFYPYNVYPEDVGITLYTNGKVVTVRNPQTKKPVTIATRYFPGANETYVVTPINRMFPAESLEP